MRNLNEIHKPTSIADALEFLQQPGAVALAGGTALNADKRADVRAVVDLSELGLAYIRESAGAIALGATTRLSALAESPILRALANGVLAQAAHQSATSILRNQATLAGTLISEPAAVLAVALLALDARVTVMGAATQTFALDAWLAARAEMPPSLVIEIGVPMSNPRAALCAVARTPSDKAIVCAVVAAQIENGIARDVRIALGGVGATATRAPAAEQTLRAQTLDDATIQNAARLAAQGISPRGDFRGSAEYRIEMAHVLTRRALKELAS